MQDNHLGVDYGAKLAGTTAAAMVLNNELHLMQCGKNLDADVWLQKLVAELNPKVLYMDAPLTLPKVYSTEAPHAEADFFYRQADREVNAMSPMFIGGLTARAMKLRTQLAAQGIAMLETYPAQANRLLLPHLQGYKKAPIAIPEYTDALKGLVKYKLAQEPQNWHQVDAILAWLSGHRHNLGKAILYGDPREGRIIV